MVAISRDLVFAGAHRPDPVHLHQAPDPALANIEASLFQLHRHPRTAVTAKAQPILFPNMGQNPHVRTRTLTRWP